MSESAVVKAGAIVREGFAGKEIERRGETAASALAAQSRAEIEARYVMAIQRPRDFGDVRTRLLKECQRPGFADRAIYSVPRGDKPGRLTGTAKRIEGLSIRFAEAAIRLAGNIYQTSRTTYDDDFKRLVLVSCVDLETNATYAKDVTIDKTIERREVKDGRVVLGERVNSAGQKVFILQATEEELLQKENALCSRALRTQGLRLIPADILEECEKAIVTTRRDTTKRDPDAARKSIADSFAELGVMPSDLALYLGVPEFAASTPVQLDDLRGLYAAIREGEITFAEALKAVTTLRDVPAPAADGKPDPSVSQAQALKERLKKRSEKIRASRGPAPAAAAATAAAPAPSAAPTPTAPAPEVCLVCGKPIVGDMIETTTNDGVVGHRHPSSKPVTREPGED